MMTARIMHQEILDSSRSANESSRYIRSLCRDIGSSESNRGEENIKGNRGRISLRETACFAFQVEPARAVSMLRTSPDLREGR